MKRTWIVLTLAIILSLLINFAGTPLPISPAKAQSTHHLVNNLPGGSPWFGGPLRKIFAEPNTNDNFDWPALVASLPYEYSQSILDYSVMGDDPDIPCILDTGFLTAWYRYTPTQNQTVAIDTLGSNYDTVLAVWTGSRGNLTHVVCNDDYDFGLAIYQSKVVVNLTAGTTYHIEVASYEHIPLGTSLSLHIASVEPEPEINLKGNNLTILNGDTTPSLADHTDFGNVLLPDGTVERTFTIENLGTANLILSGAPLVSLSGAHAADFSVTAAPSSPVAPGGSTTFSVTFDPSAAEVRSATISIANNDSDENPYTFAIQGTGITAPEINLKGNNVTILNGDTTPSLADHTDFGDVPIPTGTVERTFTIENLGTANLILSGVPLVSLSGAHAADFSVTAAPSSPVIPGGSTTFSVTFDPSAAGVRSATISIANNDSDENPYTFAIQGTGITVIYSIYLPLVAQ